MGRLVGHNDGATVSRRLARYLAELAEIAKATDRYEGVRTVLLSLALQVLLMTEMQIPRPDPNPLILIADPIAIQTPGGVRLIQPQRTNNILERFFRRLNRQGCKRTGQRPTARFIDNMLPDTPLVANLDNHDYVALLLDGCESLAQRLARVDRTLVEATLEDLCRPKTGLKRKVRTTLRARPTALRVALFILRKSD